MGRGDFKLVFEYSFKVIVKNMKFSFKKKKAFTLIEILVSISIFIIILSITIVNYRQGENSNLFRMDAFNVEDLIRTTQNISLTGKEIENNYIPDAYGIFFSDSDQIIIFGDSNSNNTFDEGIDVVFSESVLSEDVFFNGYFAFCESMISSPNLNISFIPPQPTMLINDIPTCTSSVVLLNSNSASGEWAVYFDAIVGRVWTEFTE